MADFVHLHLHTLYSLLDGAIRMKDLVQTITEKKMSTVAVTDHGNMFGAVDFYKKARAHGIKPIIGHRGVRRRPARQAGQERARLAPSGAAGGERRGLQEPPLPRLHGLPPRASDYHPRLDKELLRKHSQGHLRADRAVSAARSPGLARRGDMDGARKAALEYKDIFEPGHFFLEIQSNGLPEQEKANAELKQLSRDLDIPLVATADAHYVKREDAEAHEVAERIEGGKSLDDPKRSARYAGKLYIKSGRGDGWALFADVPEAVDNTVRIAAELQRGARSWARSILPELPGAPKGCDPRRASSPAGRAQPVSSAASPRSARRTRSTATRTGSGSSASSTSSRRWGSPATS